MNLFHFHSFVTKALSLAMVKEPSIPIRVEMFRLKKAFFYYLYATSGATRFDGNTLCKLRFTNHNHKHEIEMITFFSPF